MSYTDTLELPHGYTARIANDESPECPWKAWDCEPPITVFNEHKLDFYGDENIDLPEILRLIPETVWESRNGKRAIMAGMPCDASNVIEAMRSDWRGNRQFFREAVEELAAEFAPDSWRSSHEYFDSMRALASLAGIPCFYGQSNGYSQGDSARVFVALTPAWFTESGCDRDDTENNAAICKAAFDLWSAWAWGDVYGVASIHRPATLDEDGDEIEGEEIPDGSCWGFYGSDHEKSGLMEHCKGMVAYDLQWLAKESAAAHDAACRDVATV